MHHEFDARLPCPENGRGPYRRRWHRRPRRSGPRKRACQPASARSNALHENRERRRRPSPIAHAPSANTFRTGCKAGSVLSSARIMRTRRALTFVVAGLASALLLALLWAHVSFPSDRSPEGAYLRVVIAVNRGRAQDFFAYTETRAQHACLHDPRLSQEDARTRAAKLSRAGALTACRRIRGTGRRARRRRMCSPSTPSRTAG